MEWGETHIACDECKRRLTIVNPVGPIELPPPWRKFVIPGWIAVFHACSESHERSIRRRYEYIPPPT